MKISDTTMERTQVLPAAGANASSVAVDLGADRVGPVGDALEVHLSLTALPDLVDAKTVTLELQDCDTVGGTYATVNGAATLVALGAGGSGSAADSVRFYLPPDTRQFVKLKSTVLAAGGDNTAVSSTMKFRV